MFRWIGRLAIVAAVLGLAGVVVLGPSLGYLLKTWQAQARETVMNEWVDPQVRLETTVQETMRQLPAELAGLKSARSACEQELASQGKSIAQLQQARALVDADLRVLSAAVRQAEGCRIRGRSLDPGAARSEAGRLLAAMQRYESQLAARQAMQARMGEQIRGLDVAIARTEEAMRTFSADTREAAAKIELLKAAQRVQAIQDSVADSTHSRPLESLAGLNRDLDRRLLEQQHRARMADAADSSDPYIDAADQASVADELTRRYPAAPDPISAMAHGQAYTSDSVPSSQPERQP